MTRREYEAIDEAANVAKDALTQLANVDVLDVAVAAKFFTWVVQLDRFIYSHRKSEGVRRGE